MGASTAARTVTSVPGSAALKGVNSASESDVYIESLNDLLALSRVNTRARPPGPTPCAEVVAEGFTVDKLRYARGENLRTFGEDVNYSGRPRTIAALEPLRPGAVTHVSQRESNA